MIPSPVLRLRQTKAIALEQAHRLARSLHGAGARPPVFIVGSGRCGTTLLGVVLDAHPAIAITPETHILPDAYAKLLRARGTDAMVDVLFAFPRVAETGVAREDLLAEFCSRTLRTPAALLECFYTLYARSRGKARWGDNTPDYARHMDFIEALFGEAAFIHVIRDGRDVAVSVLPLSWGPDTVADAATWWKSAVLRTRRLGRRRRHYCELHFEHLLRQPIDALQGICRFLDEPFCPSMLDYQESARARLRQVTLDIGRIAAAERRRSHERVASGFDPSRIGRWRQTFSEADHHDFCRVAGDLLRDLGYPDVPS